jgi:tRNA-Thr(GGU) m(6)t(6)A37 methyltransferase TsaA
MLPAAVPPLLLGLGFCPTLAHAAPPAADALTGAQTAMPKPPPTYQVQPIGWVRKVDGRTTIELYDEYRPALLGVDKLDSIWVLYWFDRNDTPEQRAILQVHPRGDPANPLRGVFATRAPMRPNLIALSRCRVLGVEGNLIAIDGIDAFADTPVLDIKP